MSQDPKPRTCATCAHRSGGMTFGRCMLSGMYIEVERKFPTSCGHDFMGWTQRQPLLTRLRQWLYAARAQEPQP